MFIKPVYDLIGAIGIGGGNHLGTVGTVEKQHVITLSYSGHGHCIPPALTPNQQRLYTAVMASEEYKGFHVSAWARAEYGNGSASVGIVCKPTPRGSIIEVKRVEGKF